MIEFNQDLALQLPAITGTVAVQGFENPRKESIFLTSYTFTLIRNVNT
jgi:hypothetical protein